MSDAASNDRQSPPACQASSTLRERDEWERHFWRCRHKLTRARVLLVVAVAAALVGWLR